MPDGFDQGERLIDGRQALKQDEARFVDRHQPECHFTDNAERAFAADEEVHGIAAGREAVADRVLGAGLRDGRQVHRARLAAIDESESIAVCAIDAASKRQRAPGRELHGEPGHPVARGTEPERARTGGIGGDHAANRGAGLGRIERQRPARRPRGKFRLQVSQRRAGERADGGWSGVQIDLDHATQPRHGDEVRRSVRNGAAHDARSRTAHGDAMSVRGMPPQHRAQLVERGRLSHRSHAGGDHPRFVVQQIGDRGRVRGQPQARRSGGDRAGVRSRASRSPLHVGSGW